METQLICTICGYTGEANKKARGNGFIEFILWWFFLVPGIIYSIWSRGGSGKNVCPKCGSTTMIPVNTPIGQRMMYEQKNNPHININLPEPKKSSKGTLVILIVCLIALMLGLAIIVS